MLPMLKRTTDNLVEAIGEKASASSTFDALKQVYLHNSYRNFIKFDDVVTGCIPPTP